MRVIHCRVGEKPEFVEVDGTLEAFQRLVGGYIQEVPRPFGTRHRIIVLANEEGRLRGLPVNRTVFGSELVGNLVVTAAADAEFVTLSDDDLKVVEQLGLLPS